MLQLQNIIKHFPLKAGIFRDPSRYVHAIDNVSLSMRKGDTLGLVGESGCGKTTLGRLVVKLEEPDKGEILFEGKEISRFSKPEIRHYRREVQMVFQDTFESLNPRRTVESILSQPYLNYKLLRGSKLRDRVVDLLNIVGMRPGEMYLRRYPHQFSGGQRQRIGIARAIALDPALIIADEAVSSLDISIRGQILNLLTELRRTMGVSYLFISHDLTVVYSLCNIVAVMYLGKIVEVGATQEIFSNPLHPYTLALLSATPTSNLSKARSKKRIIMKGDVPSAVDPPSGCRFRTRCPQQLPICSAEEPLLCEHVPGHSAACHKIRESLSSAFRSGVQTPSRREVI